VNESDATRPNLSARTLHGVKWSYAATGFNAGLQIALTAVLARLLPPAAFGVVAMAGLALRFGQYFAQLGLASALVQRPELSEKDISGANWLCWGLGGAFTALFFVAAPLFAKVFSTPELTLVMEVMAVNFLLVGGSVAPLAMLRRELKFRAVAFVDVVSYVIGYGVVGLSLAFAGAGVWSLVAASLVQSVVQLAAGLFAARHEMAYRWPGLPSTAVLNFGYRVSVIGFLEFLATNMDSFGVGLALGATSLGYYSRGYNLAYLPAFYLMSSLSRVLQSSYSRIQGEIKRLRRSFFESVALLGAATIPLSFGLMGASREVVLCLLGPQWLPAVPVVAVMCLAAPLSALTRVGETIAEATAQLNQKLVIRAGHVTVFVGLLVALARFGIVGFAAAFASSEFVVFVAYYALSRRILLIDLRSYTYQLIPALVAGIAALAATATISSVCIRWSVSEFVALPLQIAAGAAMSALVLLRLRGGWFWKLLKTRLSYAGVAAENGRAATAFKTVDWIASHDSEQTVGATKP
jgi:lipopolysaccharide exporter